MKVVTETKDVERVLKTTTKIAADNSGLLKAVRVGNAAVTKLANGKYVAMLTGDYSGVTTAVASATGVASAGGVAAGNAFGQGVVAGINTYAASAAAAAAALVNNAISAAKKAGEIQSPSKRTRKEIGENLGKGIVEGLKKYRSVLTKEMKETVNASIQEAKSNVASLGSSLADQIGRLLEERSKRTIASIENSTAVKRIKQIDDTLNARDTAEQRSSLTKSIDEAQKKVDSLQKVAQRINSKSIAQQLVDAQNVLAGAKQDFDNFNLGQERTRLQGQVDAQREATEKALSLAQESASRRLAVSYTHLTLPTSDLV